MHLDQLFEGIDKHAGAQQNLNDRVKDIFIRNASIMGRIADAMIRNGRAPAHPGLIYGDAREYSARLMALAIELACAHNVTPKDVTNYLADHGYAFPSPPTPAVGEAPCSKP